MKPAISRRKFALNSLCATIPAAMPALPATASADQDERILIVVGPSKHPPGTHEVAATGRLLQHCIQQLRLPGLIADLVFSWPDDGKQLAQTSSVVFVGDMFPPVRMENSAKIFTELTSMMKRGCGMVCIHYATGLSAQDVPDDGQHPLLQWIGGYFATKCKHHQSIARVFDEAKITPSSIDHDVLRGWRSFTVHDEPYINNYFGPSGPAPGVVSLATSELPPENPRPETVAWAIERPDSGRGVGIVMPHFYRNWRQDDLRKLIMNSIVWSAKREVPEHGVDVALNDLAQFQPDSIDPIAKKK